MSPEQQLRLLDDPHAGGVVSTDGPSGTGVSRDGGIADQPGVRGETAGNAPAVRPTPAQLEQMALAAKPREDVDIVVVMPAHGNKPPMASVEVPKGSQRVLQVGETVWFSREGDPLVRGWIGRVIADGTMATVTVDESTWSEDQRQDLRQEDGASVLQEP